MSSTNNKMSMGKTKKSAARLAGVQALYQIEVNDQHPRLTIDEFREHRLGQEIDGDRYQNADTTLFETLVMGVYTDQSTLDEIIITYVPESRPFDRLEPLVRAVLRAATFELSDANGAPAKVVVNEYMDLAHAFFSGQEPRFINGMLDAIAHELKPGDF